MQRGERVLVGAVVIHHPHFLGAGARADEGDLRGADGGEAAGTSGDDFVGELVGEFADLRVGGSATIDLADDGFVGGAANVEHPCGDGDFGGGFGEIAEGDEVGVEGRIDPGGFLELRRLGGNLGGVEAGRDEFDDAGEGEIVANDLGEEGGVGFGVVGARGEVGNGDAGFVDAEAGAGAEDVLGEGGNGEWKEVEEVQEKYCDATDDSRQVFLRKKFG